MPGVPGIGGDVQDSGVPKKVKRSGRGRRGELPDAGEARGKARETREKVGEKVEEAREKAFAKSTFEGSGCREVD